MTPEIQRLLQPDGTVAGNDDRVQSSVTCFRCHNRGHYATSCPTLTSENGAFSVSLKVVAPLALLYSSSIPVPLSILILTGGS